MAKVEVKGLVANPARKVAHRTLGVAAVVTPYLSSAHGNLILPMEIGLVLREENLPHLQEMNLMKSKARLLIIDRNDISFAWSFQ
jgi:hypothetical protein